MEKGGWSFKDALWSQAAKLGSSKSNDKGVGKQINDFFNNMWSNIKTWAKNTFGASLSFDLTKDNGHKVISEPSPIIIEEGVRTSKEIFEYGDSSKAVTVYADMELLNIIESSSLGISFNVNNFELNINLAMDNIGIAGYITEENEIDGLSLQIDLWDFKIGLEKSSAITEGDTTQTAYSNISLSGVWIWFAYEAVTTGQTVQRPEWSQSQQGYAY